MKSENSLKIHFVASGKQNFIFYFEIFCCKKELTVLYYIQLKIYSIGRCTMAVSYKKLWKLLIEKDMKKTDLRIKSGISTGALAKLGKNENVNTEILAKICKVLECGVDDVMEFIPDEQN